ncbi:unnamed protein product [Zymoseptoria tritici ST99CH_1E4]|uniref:PH domain-containing protein n=1 Tax=Zymoseptoria tritici ST99CH_1E4 TaxID=1276532 RepID=A0A2H1G4Y1_ZYMTR|nr:unnamed protein product [Zymoseptoria tritici ST99CH_1E4]
MATAANPPPGAVPTNGQADPFTNSPSLSQPGAMRFAPFDNEQFSVYSTSSPASAKQALEAHLKATDARIQDASRLGQTLVQQRRDLASKLKEVEQIQQDDQVPEDLRGKLTELEREYNEIGRESARAFLPRSRMVSENNPDTNPGASVISGSGRESPTKMTAPSRRQRNQPSNRVHDIEFATEISTSLLAQVRQLQAALAEKDETLRETVSARAQLESEVTGLVQRIRHMDESEQKYKDENWNLETRLQDTEGTLKETMDKENRLAQAIKAMQSEKAATERELDDLRVSHDKLSEDHAMAKKVQESDLHGLRRDLNSFETDKERMQRKIAELTSQNTELAKAVSYRMGPGVQQSDTDFVSAEENTRSDEDVYPSEPTSPIKGTPARHGMLESETLKSSLNHAHRMIQNLKNNIHREKTEKIELKRMLQDARDDLENRRDSTGAANIAKRRKNEAEGVKFKKSGNLGRLGAARSSTTEIMGDEPDWDDYEGENTPSKTRSGGLLAGGAMAGATGAAFLSRSDADTSDAFETANERETTTESEAFATGNEDFGDDTEGELTETEDASRGMMRPVGTLSSKPGDRASYMSTASASGDDDTEIIHTPVQAQHAKYKIRNLRGVRRSGRVSDIAVDSPGNNSPSSTFDTPPPQGMQSLGDELDALDEDSLEGTPASIRSTDDDLAQSTPGTSRHYSVDPDTPSRAADGLDNEQVDLPSQRELNVARPAMVDSGMMTDPWEPESKPVFAAAAEVQPEPQSVRDRAVDMVGGALAGFGVSRVIGSGKENPEEIHPGAARDVTSGTGEHKTIRPALSMSSIDSQDYEPAVGEDTPRAGKNAPRADVSHSGFQTRDFPYAQSGFQTREFPYAQSGFQTRDFPYAQSGFQTRDFPYAHTGTAAESIEADGTKGFSPGAIGTATQVHRASVSDSSFQTRDFPYASIGTVPNEANVTHFGSQTKDFPYIHTGSDGITNANVTHLGSQTKDFPYIHTGSDGIMNANVVHFGSQTKDFPYTHTGSDGFDHEEATGVIPGTQVAPPGVGFFGMTGPAHGLRSRRSSEAMPASERNMSIATPEPPILSRAAVLEQGSQTNVSGQDIDSMIKNKKAVVVRPSTRDFGVSPLRVWKAPPTAVVPTIPESPTKTRFSEHGRTMYEAPTLATPARPTSAGSTRERVLVGAPPLPPDHNQKIAAATQQAPGTPVAGPSFGAMGPPTMPASAFKRPKTPASRDGTTPRPAGMKSFRPPQSPSGTSRMSRRTSVSSFASELDERFNITRGHILYPNDVEPSTDPRMIQAITQTMIGEYLWKYTRKAGRSEASTTRHRRFFWIHPYTRTLYWSEQDPSTAGKNMLKAKSVAIDAVRVITDDNAYPPGLHRKTIVVITPGREILFTAPTGQRHETWFNSLSYLLLRTEGQQNQNVDGMTQDDLEEFNPPAGRSLRQSISRVTGRSQSRQSRTSLSSYNSRTTRGASPVKRGEVATSLNQRAGATSQQSSRLGDTIPSLHPTSAEQRGTVHGSSRGRFSSVASRFGRSSSRTPADPAAIYDASVAADSAEDLRAVIERQEREADRLENVRACCDGKHDVGSLSRSGKHGRHSHSHK